LNKAFKRVTWRIRLFRR